MQQVPLYKHNMNVHVYIYIHVFDIDVYIYTYDCFSSCDFHNLYVYTYV